MKNLRRTFTVLFAAAFSMQVLAQREDKLINQDWSFRFSHQVNASAARRVDLPHTWNAQDALGGKHDYKRGIGNYTKKNPSRVARQAAFFTFRGGELREQCLCKW